MAGIPLCDKYSTFQLISTDGASSMVRQAVLLFVLMNKKSFSFILHESHSLLPVPFVIICYENGYLHLAHACPGHGAQAPLGSAGERRLS